MSDNVRNRIGVLGQDEIKFIDLFERSVRPLPNKIYIVIGMFNFWETFDRNLRAFYTRESAEKYAEKATRVLKAMSEHVDKMNRMQSLDKPEYEELEVEEILKLQEELEESDEFLLASKVWGVHHNLQDFLNCKIEEIEIE